MPDVPRNPGHDHATPSDWHQAFTALPVEMPPTDGWSRLVAALDVPDRHAKTSAPSPRRISRLTWLATAAALLLAVALPWRLLHAPSNQAASGVPVASTQVASSTDDETAASLPSMQALYAESAQLESLLAFARDDRLSSGTAIALADQLDNRIAAIDVALAQPALDAERERILWHERVLSLRALVSFQSSRRWLAVNGERYDGVLVRVD